MVLNVNVGTRIVSTSKELKIINFSEVAKELEEFVNPIADIDFRNFYDKL
jgi:hypothetical protein